MAATLLLFLFPLLLLFLLLLSLFFVTRPHPPKIPIANRHIFVTGGSSGIGLAIARTAAAAGARVSIMARGRSKLEEARHSIHLSTGADVATYSVDVRDEEAVRRALEDAGPVDVLVCSHGVFLPQELAKQAMEEVRFMLDVNLVGTFNLIKAVLPRMKQQRRDAGGRCICLISSQAGQVGVHGYAAYSASKFALRGLAEALQQEVIGDGIRITLAFPPDTDTPGFEQECKRRPEITSIIAGSSGVMKAETVAKRTLEGIRRGRFVVSCNFEGFMLSLATAGFSPQSSCVVAFAEVVLASSMRFVGLCIQWSWFRCIHRFQARTQSQVAHCEGPPLGSYDK